MKLIVGLGNPGIKYNKTRHNIGFMVIDELIKNFNLSNPKEKFNGKYYEKTINEEKIIFLKPYNFMNLSGEVISSFIKYYKMEVKDVLIISDDLDIDCGKFKIKGHGGTGGHNGLKNIEAELKTNEYKRIKVGISKNPLVLTENYVLEKIPNEELLKINDVIQIIVKIVNDYLYLSFEELMNKYNGENKK